MKKKILITYDAPGWAYYKNACILKKYLSEYYDIDLIYDQDKNYMLNYILNNKYDLVFLQWFPDIDFFINYPVLQNIPFVTQVTSKVFFRKYKNENWRSLEKCPLTVTKNLSYFNDLKEIVGEEKTRLAYHVFDTDNFYYKDKTRNKNFIVGYVGRNCSISDENKGHSIIKKACDNINIQFKIAGWDNKISYDKMPEFYRSVDLVICNSRHEGAPNGVIEAGLCGTPILTTKVGQIQEMVEDYKNGIFIDRSQKDIEEKISILMNDEVLYNQLSINASKTFRNFSLKAFNQWKSFFDESISYYERNI